MQDRMRMEGHLESFGSQHTIYTRLNRWSKKGVLERVYTALATEWLRASPVFGMDSTAVKAHRNAHGAAKKGGQAIGKTHEEWNTKIHVVAASDTVIAGFLLSSGNEADAPGVFEMSNYERHAIHCQ